MWQVRAGAYVSLLAPGKTDNTAYHRKKTTTCTLHVVTITTHTHDRRKPNGKTKPRKDMKIIEESKKKTRKKKNKKERKEEKRQEKQGKARQEDEARRAKKNAILADTRNPLKTAFGS